MANAPSSDDVVAHARFVRALACELARDASAADDLASRTLTEAIARRPDAGPGLRVWMRRVLWRTFRRDRRDDERRRRRELAAARPEAQPAAADLAAQMELQQLLADAFAALDEPWKSTLFHRYFRDLTPTQIADETATPLATVKSRLQRGLEQLRERLDAAHHGRREEWLAALVPWISGTSGGVVVGGTLMAMKSKVAALAVGALLVVTASVGVIATTRRAARDAEVAALPMPAVAARAIGDAGDSVDDPAPAIAQRTVDPAALPFAAGVVVDSAGVPIAGVRVVASRLKRVKDGTREYLCQWPFAFDYDSIEAGTVAQSDDEGRFVVPPQPDDEPGLVGSDDDRGAIVSLRFVRERFGLVELHNFAPEPAENQSLRVVLSPGRPVHGTVRETDGRPLALASVRIRAVGESMGDTQQRVARHLRGAPEYVAFPSASLQSARCGPDGGFDLFCAPDCLFETTTSARGFLTDTVTLAALPDPWDPELTREDLLLEIVDADTKAPIADVCAIVVARSSGVVQEIAHPVTEFVGPEPRVVAGRLLVSVQHPGGGLTWLLIAPDQTVDATIHVAAVGYHTKTIDTPITAKVEPPHLRVELAPDPEQEGESSLAGRVVGPADAEVALHVVQAAVHGIDPAGLLQYPPHLVAHCADDGAFAFPKLPDADYLLVAKAKGCAPVREDVKAPARDLVLTLDASSSLEVTVVDRNGRPLQGSRVHVQDADGKNAWTNLTDDQGHARFESLPIGKLRVLALAPARDPGNDLVNRSGRATAIDTHLFAAEEVFVAQAGVCSKVALRPVERRPVTLHVLRDDGSPAPEAKLEYSGASRGISQLVYTEAGRIRGLDVAIDARGDATLDLYPGVHWFLAVDGRIRESEKVDVPREGPASATFRLPDVRPFGTLRGRVVELGSGAPIVGRDLKVYALRPNGGSNTAGTATTDAEGRYAIPNVPSGDVLVEARAHLFGGQEGDGRPDPDSAYCSAEYRTRVEAGREAVVDFELPPVKSKTARFPTIALDARVRDAVTDSPFEGATIEVHVVRGATDLFVGSVVTGPDGRARADVFADDHYLVYVAGPTDPKTLQVPWKFVKLELEPRDGVLVVAAELAKRE